MLPLWTGLIPFGLAYALSARTAGLSAFDTQLMSVVVLAGSAQFSAAGLFGIGASGASIILTTFIVNLRHLLYTLSLGQRLELSWPQKLLAAHIHHRRSVRRDDCQQYHHLSLFHRYGAEPLRRLEREYLSGHPPQRRRA